MALASKLVKIGFGSREAKALGLRTEYIAAGGTTQANATPTTESITVVSGASTTNGIILPTYNKSNTGLHFIVNADPTNSFVIYPAVGEQLNGLGANNAGALQQASHALIYLGEDGAGGLSWWGFYSQQLPAYP